MRALRVNADYESVLFHGRPAPAMVNQSLEFLAFFLSPKPLLSQKRYAPDYLDYVHEKTGHRPRVLEHADEVENWWGLLKDTERERWWNSKLTSVEFLRSKSWIDGLCVLSSQQESLPTSHGSYLLKDPYSMSGQKFQVVSAGGAIQWRDHKVLIAEPLLNRKWDFSSYVFPNEKCITYQNLVDQNFQYRGSIFPNWTQADLNHLPFYSSINPELWEEYQSRLSEVVSFYSRFPNEIGFSIDAFVYEKNGLLIHPLCEVNYRRTMGRIAYELSERFAKDDPWTGMFLFKPGRMPAWKQLKSDPNMLVLSPGDTRFEVLFLKAKDRTQALEKIESLETLLPHAQAAIHL
jgi:hypothetical protein